ncbi:NAD(P)/FAD-dependent oxidoreductase [Nocardioides sp. MAHUQ-72]|uniref:NAD(P)/FAD-dependent oxidoreductase n=1 Tax=unclassified Nocardioides TaxID=2615069 RepID=UPI00361A4793
MPRLAVLGGSVVGAATALLFARSGWRVTVVDPEHSRFSSDRDTVEPRPGAPHAVQAHGFMARAWHELATRLPDVATAVTDAGAPVVRLGDMVPPPLLDGGRPRDDELTTLRCRRVTLDRVVGRALAAEPGVEVLHTRATGLVLDEAGPLPRVRGLGLADGGDVEADVVVDAGGRRSPVPGWLAGFGHPLVEQVDPSTVRYYTRHFRVDPARAPRPNRGYLEAHEYPSFLQLLFLGDNDTAMLALCVHDGDPLFKQVRDEDAFTAVARGNTGLATWLDAMQPTTPVFCLGSLDNRFRSTVRDGRPVVLGLHQVGDSLAMTNPTRGRGIAMGLAGAGALHDLLAAGPDDDATVALAAWQRRVLAVYYREATATDAAVGRKLRAAVEGVPAPANAPDVELPDGHPIGARDLERAAGNDPDLFRIVMRASMVMDDDRVVARRETTALARSVLGRLPPADPPPPPAADGLHDRDELARLLATVA